MRTFFWWLSGSVRRKRIAAVYAYCARIVEAGKRDPVAVRIFKEAEKELK